MKYKRLIVIPGIFYLLLLCTGCKKFLDEKPRLSLAIPSTVSDLQAILDALNVNDRDPSVDEASTDDYYLLEEDFASLSVTARNAYTWQAANLYEYRYNDWTTIYLSVYRANQVLDLIDKIAVPPAERERWVALRGQAAFIRAKNFLTAASIWAVAYDEVTATTDPGIPLRMTTDFNVATTRATMAECYAQVIADLRLAIPLLPLSTPHPFRPNKAAGLGLLARTYLWMRDYDSCYKYADLALGLNDDLLDFNVLDAFSDSPFNDVMYSNPEDLVQFYVGPTGPVGIGLAKVDSMLVNSYATGDLRKNVFLAENSSSGTISCWYKGGYSGPYTFYRGVATDELWLMRAECLARMGDKDAALADLNTLLIKRWDNAVAFPAVEAVTAEEALQKVLTERRKELLFRGLRWMDLKRLNMEGAGIILKRYAGGQEYILPPNDKRYALPIPLDVILQSGIEQN